MNIRPIKTEADYENTLYMIEQLWDAQPGTAEGDKLDILATLVDAYENQNFPILPPDPVEAILFIMENTGLTRRDLEPYIGTRARVSEIVNRKRPLSLTMIRKLNKGLGIPAEILVQPYDLEAA